MRDIIASADLKTLEYMGKKTHEEVCEEMRRAEFLIMPSEWYEGFPLVIVEAFSNGLPVIASRLGSMAEIVRDYSTGLIVNPGDPDDLTAKMRWAQEHPSEMKNMGIAARCEYNKSYTPERNYRLLMSIYESIRH